MNFFETYKEDIMAFFKALVDLIKALFGAGEEEKAEDGE